MTKVEIPIRLDAFPEGSDDRRALENAYHCRSTAHSLAEEERYMDALERTIEALRTLREFSDYENTEFRALLSLLLYDLAELYFALDDFKQSEHQLDILFKILDPLVKDDSERFGPFHILAMELSTRILRSKKKTIDLLAKQQLVTSLLYEKVNSGVVAATDKLVESLRKVARLLGAAGDYKASLKFYAEAIKFSKRRSGRVTRKEVKMTIEMAKIMMRIHHMRARAKHLLNAVLHHAIALETVELEEEILALIEIIDADIEREPKWKNFLRKISVPVKKAGNKVKEAGNKVKEESEGMKVVVEEKIVEAGLQAAKAAHGALRKAKRRIDRRKSEMEEARDSNTEKED